MEKRLLVFVLLFVSFGFGAQNVNRAWHFGVQRANSLCCINSKFYCTEKNRAQAVTHVLTFDAQQNPSIVYNFQKAMSSDIITMKKSRDKNLIFVGQSRSDCPITLAAQFDYYFVKIDTSGTELFCRTIPQFSATSAFYFDMTQLLDSSYYITDGSKLIHVSKDGQSHSELVSPIQNIWQWESLSNGNLLISGTNGIQEVNTQLMAVNQNTAQGGFLLADNGNIITVSGTTLSVLNQSLQPLSSSTTVLLPASQGYYVALKNDSIAIAWADQPNATLHYALCNQSLTVLSQSVATFGEPLVNGLAVNNKGRVMVLVNSPLPGLGSITPFGGKSHASVFHFPLMGGYKVQSDLAVESISLRSASTFSMGMFQAYLMGSFDVTLKNMGADTIKKFNLSYFMQAGLCFDEISGASYSLEIAPGQTGTLTTGGIPLKQLWGNQIQTHTIGVCLFSTIPNNSNDINLNNDIACAQVVLTVGLDEQPSENEQLVKVFPNPFSSELKFSASELVTEISLYNSLGMLITTINSDSQELSMDTQNLLPGIYFMHYTTEKGIGIKKLIKQ